MGMPAARVGDMTATGDTILPPCCPMVLTVGMPQAGLGDLVAGPVMTGAIAKGSATVIVGGKPAARMLDTVVGVNNFSGAPLTQPVLMVCAPTVVIGG
jgi:uncharacterized Zn-binding protein involved in type VI secretion